MPHPFFWAAAAAVGVGILAGALTAAKTPAAALHSTLVYRVEVGLIVGLALYVAALLLWHAWHGRAASRIGMPGGASIEAAGESLDQAASELDAFQTTTDARISLIEDAVVELTEKRRAGESPDDDQKSDSRRGGQESRPDTM